MSALRQLRNFWIPWVTMIVLACFSDAVAQASYKVTEFCALNLEDLGCAMGGNDHGRAGINIEGLKTDLGTLGGKNSWTNYGGINDRGEPVGLAETAVPDPNGEH